VRSLADARDASAMITATAMATAIAMDGNFTVINAFHG
jgi:hypothetical protein